mgnify:CR=1 FL=1
MSVFFQILQDALLLLFSQPIADWFVALFGGVT